MAPARALSKQISEEMYFHALLASAELAEEKGAHPAFAETRAANGELQMDLWGVTPSDPERWQGLRDRVAAHVRRACDAVREAVRRAQIKTASSRANPEA